MKKGFIILIAVVLVAAISFALVFAALKSDEGDFQSPVTAADDMQPGDASQVAPEVDSQTSQPPMTSPENIQLRDPSRVAPNIVDQARQPPVTPTDDTESDPPSPAPNVTDRTGQGPITSADGIGPNECSLVHNINACK